MSVKARSIVSIESNTYRNVTLAIEALPQNEMRISWQDREEISKMTVAVENMREFHQLVGDLLDFYDEEEADD